MKATAAPAPAQPETLPERDADPAPPPPAADSAQPAAPWTREQTISLLGALGTWAAAFATVAAVAVSLVLARRATRVDLKVSADFHSYNAGAFVGEREYIEVGITNQSTRAVTVQSTQWRIGRGRARRYEPLRIGGESRNRLPIQLADGQSAALQTYTDDDATWVDWFTEDFLRPPTKSNLGSLRVLVHTSLGQTFEVEPAPALLDYLREEAVKAGTAATRPTPAPAAPSPRRPR